MLIIYTQDKQGRPILVTQKGDDIFPLTTVNSVEKGFELSFHRKAKGFFNVLKHQYKVIDGFENKVKELLSERIVVKTKAAAILGLDKFSESILELFEDF